MVYWTKRAIRKYGVFADGPILPFHDTGFWARNGVSLQGKTSVSQNLLAIQTFGRKRVYRCMEKQLNVRKPVRDWSIGPDESWVTVKISRLRFFTIFAAVF